MAIERQGELPKAQTPTEEEFIEQVTISQPEEEVGFVMMEDGSAIPESELDVNIFSKDRIRYCSIPPRARES